MQANSNLTCKLLHPIARNNIEVILLFFYKRFPESFRWETRLASNSKNWVGKKKKRNGRRKERFIDHRSLDGARRYGLFRAYRSVRSLIGCTRGGGLVSRVEGGVRSTVVACHMARKRAAVDRIACSSSLLKPAHAYCLSTWFADGTIIYAAIVPRLRDR